MWFWRKRKMKVYEEFIRAHLTKKLANRPIIGFDYYFLAL